MLKCISDIIEGMGFKKVNDIYTAKFISNFTNNIIEVVVDDLTDDPDDSAVVRFHAYNDRGNLLSCQTLDQMLVACETELTLIEGKWDEEYAVYFNIDVQVPVKLSELSDKDREMLLMDYVTDKKKLIRDLALQALHEEFKSSKLHMTTATFNFSMKLEENI